MLGNTPRNKRVRIGLRDKYQFCGRGGGWGRGEGACKNLIFDFSQDEDIGIALLGYDTAALGRELILFYSVIERG